jgi:hypothetical protein
VEPVFTRGRQRHDRRRQRQWQRQVGSIFIVDVGKWRMVMVRYEYFIDGMNGSGASANHHIVEVSRVNLTDLPPRGNTTRVVGVRYVKRKR